MAQGLAFGRRLARDTKATETAGQCFFGVDCPNLGVGCLIHQLMKLHMHFGCKASLGTKLKVSVETLAVELGIFSQPLSTTMLCQVWK